MLHIKRIPKSISDLCLVIFALIVILIISMNLDIHERYMNFVMEYDEWELNELLSTGPFLFVVLSVWYSYRRLVELIERNKIIQDNYSRYSSLVESTDDSIYLVDRNHNYIFINKEHLSRIGLNENQYIGKPFSAFHSPEETELFISKAEQVFRKCESMQFEYKSFKEDTYYLQTYSPVMGKDNMPIAISIISKDITKLKHMEKELRALSLKDDLTVLYNRRGFTTLGEQYLKMAKRDNKGFYVMYADLDNLKTINDKFGHHEGSSAIIQIANILRDNHRESDIIARLGGDEFAVILVANAGDNIDIIISRLQERINSYNSQSSHVYKLSLSIGISYFDPENPCSLEELIKKADKLMYEHKRNKKKRVSV